MQKTPREALEAAARDPDFADISALPNVRVDLRYGSKQNILNLDVYGGFQRALLHKLAAGKFETATELLGQRFPGLNFVIFDALRPQSAQIAFWNLVKGTPQEPYFADPARGSVHSYGFALDIGLERNGSELDMGTGFDDLSDLAEPRLETELLEAGRLTSQQLAHRGMLRSVMEDAGFIQLPREWWHYDALPGSEVRASYRRCE